MSLPDLIWHTCTYREARGEALLNSIINFCYNDCHEGIMTSKLFIPAATVLDRNLACSISYIFQPNGMITCFRNLES
jgi:hypothetical protein